MVQKTKKPASKDVGNYSVDIASADDIAEIERLVIVFTSGLAYAKYEQTRERAQEKK